jgi:hypothetical protein
MINKNNELEWTGADGTKHFMPISAVEEELKRVYDEWPCGYDEMESSLRTWKNMALSAAMGDQMVIKQILEIFSDQKE